MEAASRLTRTGAAGVAVLSALIGCIPLRPTNTDSELTRQEMISRHLTGRELEPVEGVWGWADGQYEVAIVRNVGQAAPEYEFVGIVTDTRNRSWRRGDVKLALKASASPTVFTGICVMGNGYEQGTSFVMASPNTIELFVPTGPYGIRERLLLIRMLPKDGTAPTPVEAPGVSHGTGFFVSGDTVATNFHVVEGAKEVHVYVAGERRLAELLVRDQANDLALLRVGASATQRNVPCLPLQERDTTKAGDKAFVLGFPLAGVLASSLNVAEGLVSSVRGIRDDPRMLQISVPIQPGHSGSPLLDPHGRVIGVVTATLNPRATLASQDALPQNANFAIRAAYLRSLLALLPSAMCVQRVASSEMTAAQLQEAFGPAVVNVEARR